MELALCFWFVLVVLHGQCAALLFEADMTDTWCFNGLACFGCFEPLWFEVLVTCGPENVTGWCWNAGMLTRKAVSSVVILLVRHEVLKLVEILNWGLFARYVL